MIKKFSARVLLFYCLAIHKFAILLIVNELGG